MIKAVIVDDEKSARELLRGLIEDHSQVITIAGEAGSVDEALKVIAQEKPRILFLDIEMGKETSFDLLQKLEPGMREEMELIFTTAHESYALQAIKFAALDYLLKPITKDDLKQALEKIENRKMKLSMTEVMELFRHNLDHNTTATKRIVLPVNNRYETIPISEIIRCQSDDNYTTFFLKDKRKLVVAKTLKEYEELLEKFDFCRVHHYHLINMAHVKGYQKGEGGSVIMDDGSEVSISRRKKEEFLKHFL